VRSVGCVVALFVAGGCDLVFTVPDRAMPDGSPVGMCAFSAPAVVGFATMNPFDPALRGDELELYYVQSDVQNGFDMFHSRRTTTAFEFVAALRDEALDTSSDERDPTFTADGLRMLFLTRRTGTDSIAEAIRTDPKDSFTTAMVHGDLPGFLGITVSYDGLRLYGDNGSRLRMYTRASLTTAFDTGKDAGPSIRFPTISHDERELLFEQDMMIYRLTRATTDVPFDGTPERVLVGQDPYLADSGLTLALRANGQLAIAKRDCVPE
jgi:hypothetical protein